MSRSRGDCQVQVPESLLLLPVLPVRPPRARGDQTNVRYMLIRADGPGRQSCHLRRSVQLRPRARGDRRGAEGRRGLADAVFADARERDRRAPDEPGACCSDDRRRVMAVTFRAATCPSVRSSGITAYLKSTSPRSCAPRRSRRTRGRATRTSRIGRPRIVRVALPRRSDLKEGPSDMPSFAPGVRERFARSPVQRAPRRAAGPIGHSGDRQRIDTRRRERLRFSRLSPAGRSATNRTSCGGSSPP